MNCICPECGKEIIPIINAVVPNINGANPLSVVTHLDLVIDGNNPPLHINFHNTGCAAQPIFSNWQTLKF